MRATRAGAAAAAFPYLRTRARYMIGYCIESILFFFQAVSIIFIFSFLFFNKATKKNQDVGCGADRSTTFLCFLLAEVMILKHQSSGGKKSFGKDKLAKREIVHQVRQAYLSIQVKQTNK